MRSSLLFLLLGWAVQPTFSQAIESKVYSFGQLPVVNQPSCQERNLFDGTSRDFSHLLAQAITIDTNQPVQPVQQLDEETILICKGGELTLTLAGKRTVLAPGSVVVVMPGDDFRIENKAARPLTYYQIRYTSNEMPDLDLYRLTGQSFLVDWQTVPVTAGQSGNSRRFVPYPTVMSQHVAMALVQAEADSVKNPTHTHRPAELIVILNHPARILLNETWSDAQPGDFIFVESELSHAVQANSPKGCTYLSIQL